MGRTKEKNVSGKGGEVVGMGPHPVGFPLSRLSDRNPQVGPVHRVRESCHRCVKVRVLPLSFSVPTVPTPPLQPKGSHDPDHTGRSSTGCPGVLISGEPMS